MNRNPAVFAVWGLALFSLAVAGCGSDTETETSILQSLNAPSQQEAEAFAQELESAAASKDKAKFDSMVDWQAIGQTSVADLELTPENRKEYIKGLLDSLQQRGGFSTEVVSALNGGGSYKFLRVHEVDGQTRVLFRLLLGNNGGVNYHDYVLHKDDSGTVKAVDFHVTMSGELMSDTLRRFAIPFVAQQNKGVMDRLAGKEEDMVKHADDVQRMSSSMKSNPAQTLSIYNSLPESLKKDKSLMLIRIQAASLQDETQYGQAIDDFRQAYPNDPVVELLAIDSYFLNQEWDKALAGIDKLDQAVGGDPYLHILRAGVYTQMGNTQKAMEATNKAFQEEPGLEDLL